MRFPTAVLVITALLASGRICAQSLHTDPVFEVTSIKVNEACGGPGRGSGARNSPGRMTLECAELRDLILTAYGIYADGHSANPQGFRMQVLGGPAWLDSDRYDIRAKAEGDPPMPQMYGPMLRALLEDRFKLKVHRETKQAPVYLLTIAKNGPKLRSTRPAGTFEIVAATIPDLCTQLGLRLDRDVIDKTGITGTFDLHLEVSEADLKPRALAGSEVRPADPSTGVSIFTAVQQQLGLKLESGQAPVAFLVIDHIQKPSPN